MHSLLFYVAIFFPDRYAKSQFYDLWALGTIFASRRKKRTIKFKFFLLFSTLSSSISFLLRLNTLWSIMHKCANIKLCSFNVIKWHAIVYIYVLNDEFSARLTKRERGTEGEREREGRNEKSKLLYHKPNGSIIEHNQYLSYAFPYWRLISARWQANTMSRFDWDQIVQQDDYFFGQTGKRKEKKREEKTLGSIKCKKLKLMEKWKRKEAAEGVKSLWVRFCWKFVLRSVSAGPNDRNSVPIPFDSALSTQSAIIGSEKCIHARMN